MKSYRNDFVLCEERLPRQVILRRPFRKLFLGMKMGSVNIC